MDSDTEGRGSGFCGATRRQIDEGDDQARPCRKVAGWGTDHVGTGRCRLHGGKTGAQRKNAQVAIVRQAAQVYGHPREIDPADGLMEEYFRIAGLVSSIEARVMMLTGDEIVSGTTTEDTAEGVGSIEDAKVGGTPEQQQIAWKRKVVRAAALNVWVKLYNEERNRFMALGAKIVELGLEARRTSIMQTQVSLLVGLIMHPDLALTHDQRRTFARLLRELEQGGIAA